MHTHTPHKHAVPRTPARTRPHTPRHPPTYPPTHPPSTPTPPNLPTHPPYTPIPSPLTVQIRRDVIRTDCNENYYSNNSVHLESLYNILVTYSLTHPSISYRQVSDTALYSSSGGGGDSEPMIIELNSLTS